MFNLQQPTSTIPGIGPKTAAKLAKKQIETVKDLLLWVPLRYEDRSTQKKINQLEEDELVTIQAEVISVSNQYKGRRSIQRATVQDETGRLKLIWFNSPYLKDSLKQGQNYFFSGKLNEYRQMAQPKFETIKKEALHTNRLVPVYSSIPGVKQGNLRRFLKNTIDALDAPPDPVAEKFALLPFKDTFKNLHFPDEQNLTIQARERLALEELLSLMQHAQEIKQDWQQNKTAPPIKIDEKQLIPDHLPFELTDAQRRSTHEILFDLKSERPMNRLLLGDVGSGKTVVATIAAHHTLVNKKNAALIAPTQVLAEQHQQTLKKLLPQLKLQLLTAQTKVSDLNFKTKEPTFYLGTHAILNHLEKIKPALVIYDEQHRFGVAQRSETDHLKTQPHLLTMSATPIPRSLMLTIFAHLKLSLIDEMPPGRKPNKTWLVPEKKRTDSYAWIKQQLKQSGGQALVVCPFINPSEHEAFEKVKSATETYGQLKAEFSELEVELLHGQMNKKEQQQVIKQLFAQEIDILVTTPIVEVGVDLPAAKIMLIESAERFGLASLHQLRGRVGRAGQQGSCLLFTDSQSPEALKRLKVFTQTNDGTKLAEFDLQNRGAGDLFGLEQHGFDQLQFASWTNTELIGQAKKIFEQSEQLDEFKNWQPLIQIHQVSTTEALQPN